jgi:hypothetical protein
MSIDPDASDHRLSGLRSRAIQKLGGRLQLAEKRPARRFESHTDVRQPTRVQVDEQATSVQRHRITPAIKSSATAEMEAIGYAISLSRRPADRKGLWLVEANWSLRQVKLRGLEKVGWLFVFSCAALNLIRLPKLMAPSPGRLGEQCA